MTDPNHPSALVSVPREPTEAMLDAWHKATWPQGPRVSPLSQQGLSFARAYRAMLAAAPAAPQAAGAGEIDLYDDKVQAGIAWTMRQWGETLGLKTWTQGDGSESVEGDVGAEIHTILVDAGLRDPETNEMASLRAQPQAREDAQPVIAAGRTLADALRQYGFPVSGGAKAALTDHGSAEAFALNEAAVAFLAALQAEQGAK